MTTTEQKPKSFDQFALPKPLANALVTLRYKEPTPIQQKALPYALDGKDIVGIAQTGTGKTAAYAIPLIKTLFLDHKAQAIVLVPTRELAMQIFVVIRQLTQNINGMKAWVLVGGTSMFAQVKSLPTLPRIVIATPGRLMDHLRQKTFHLQNLKVAVLDEADRMLDIGFEPQLQEIFRFVPRERQTMLYSATFPKTVERLSRLYMHHPQKITVGQISEPATDVTQVFIQTTLREKNMLLMDELDKRRGSVLIFVRTKHKADRLYNVLKSENFQADRFHGDLSQSQRNRVIEDFRQQRLRILIATDVASRGLDIPHIEHVINFDLPEIPDDYIHRIGRTARAGAKGEALSFVTPEDGIKWRNLTRHLQILGTKLTHTVKI